MKNTEGNTLISLNKVGLSYSRRSTLFKKSIYWALRNISLDLYSGETLGIIGKNGVGKSTLLKVLAGIIAPDEGKIVTHQTGLKISLISIQAGFAPYLSGRENAILSGVLLGATRNEILSQIDNIIAFSELDSFFEEPINTYSTGMRARLGFSVAYHLDPDIILLDEVLGVGDEAFRKKSTEAMKKRIKSDKTVVLVSHSMPLVREVCDRLVWIEDGESMAQGNVTEVLNSYLKYIESTKNTVKSN